MPIIRSAYSKNTRSPFLTMGDSRTKQCFKDECDLNNILRKYRKTGLIEHLSVHQGDYKDISEPIDYQTALNTVLSAQVAFDSLPSDLRKQFDNNPGLFLDFVDNPDNADKLVEMGLANAPVNQVNPVEALPQPGEPDTPEA